MEGFLHLRRAVSAGQSVNLFLARRHLLERGSLTRAHLVRFYDAVEAKEMPVNEPDHGSPLWLEAQPGKGYFIRASTRPDALGDRKFSKRSAWLYAWIEEKNYFQDGLQWHFRENVGSAPLCNLCLYDSETLTGLQKLVYFFGDRNDNLIYFVFYYADGLIRTDSAAGVDVGAELWEDLLDTADFTRGAFVSSDPKLVGPFENAAVVPGNVYCAPTFFVDDYLTSNNFSLAKKPQRDLLVIYEATDASCLGFKFGDKSKVILEVYGPLGSSDNLLVRFGLACARASCSKEEAYTLSGFLDHWSYAHS